MQSINEISPKIKTKVNLLTKERGVFIPFILIITAVTSFGLGRLSKTESGKTPILIKNNTASILNALEEPNFSSSIQLGGQYVASKNSTKYHAPWCSGAKRIKVSNQVWFTSKEEAELAGYTPASNCKGI